MNLTFLRESVSMVIATKNQTKQQQLKGQQMKCSVFMNCGNKATTEISHPILGGVPACQRCADKMARLKA